MQWLANLCVRRPVFALVLMLSICVIGAAGYFRLGLDRFPKVDIPMIVVTTRLDGAAPEEVETEITDKIEEAVNTINGIDELRSTSSEGVSQVFISFVLEKDVDVAAQDVRDHVNTIIPDLPKGIDQPVVTKLDPDASPVLYIAVNADKPVREITELADKQIRRRIESIAGVGQVTLVGGRKRQINIWLDPVALRAAGLIATDVQRAVANQNLTTPGGSVDTGPQQLTLRVRGRVATPAEIGRIVVRQSGSHATRVEDIARVEDGEEEEETNAAKDGHPTIVLSVRKQSGENTIAVVDGIQSRLAEIKNNLPSGYSIEIVRDSSEVIRTSVDAVKEHLVLGAVFAAIVVLIFLGNLRSTMIAAVAIPISIIGTFALMWIEGFTLNVITLLALALAVGIVIDDAIVVLENIFRFVNEKKVKPFPAAILATRDIGLAVLATTLSLMAVFLPVSFMDGIIGRFLKSFGLTMAFAIGVSLFVSFSLTPMLSARWLKANDAVTADSKKPFLERVVDVFYVPIERFYITILRWVMHQRWIVVFLASCTLMSCYPLLKAVPKGFLPESDEAQFEMNVRAPEGTSIQATVILAERIARDVRKMEGVTHTLTTIGDNDKKTPNLAKIYVRLVNPAERKESQAELMARARHEIVARQSHDLRIDVSEVSAFATGGSSATIQYLLSGPDLGVLEKYTGKILEEFRKVPGAVDVDSNLIVGKPEYQVLINREKAAALGVQVADIANVLQLLVGGLQVSTYEEKGEDYDIWMRADRRYRADLDGLTLVTVSSSMLGSVPLRSVVDVLPATGPSEVNRLTRQRQVTLTANVAPGVGQSDIQTALEKIIQDVHMPAGYSSRPTGSSRETGKAATNFGLAFAMSFIFMYLVLAAQFESWLHPVTILLALPLTVPFALISLLLFHQTLNIFSTLGLLVLFGVVKKNAILQVDHTNHLRAEGRERLDAILEANRDRLRPILMTTLAFVAGMVPLAMSNGIGGSINRATAGVIIGGQMLSLLLTLLATPVAYSLFDDVSLWFKRLTTSGEAEDKGETEIDHLDDLYGAHESTAE